MIVHPYRIPPSTAGGCLRRSPCHEEWGRNPGWRSQTVETIQILLIGGEGGKETILPSQGEGPGFPLMGVPIPLPEVVRMGPVLVKGPVKSRLSLVLTVVPAGVKVLIPPAVRLGCRGTPGSRKGPRSFPELEGGQSCEISSSGNL